MDRGEPDRAREALFACLASQADRRILDDAVSEKERKGDRGDRKQTQNESRPTGGLEKT
jgi:hypothetical protein